SDLSEVHLGTAHRCGILHMCGAMKIFRAFLFIITGLCLSVPALRAQNSKVFVPHSSWDCGMPGGIPNPESGVLIFESDMKLERVSNIGKTPYGDRQVAVVQEGTLSGTKV